MLGICLLYLVLFILCRWIYTEFVQKTRKAPPSPIKFPGIGNLIQLYRADSVRPFVAFQKLAAVHGNVLSIRSGIVDLVVINGYKDVKEAMMCDSFLPRMTDTWLMDRSYGKPQGIIVSSLDIWKESRSRRHTIRNLRDFGFGKSNILESNVVAQVEDIVERLEKDLEKSRSLPMNKFFLLPIVNVVWSLIAGASFDSDDAKLHDLNQRIDDYFKSGNFGSSLMTAYPFLKDWAPSLCGYEKQHSANMAMNRFLEDVLVDYKTKIGKRDSPHNFVEAFLSQINVKSDNIFNEQNLVSILYDLFIAGTETTSNTLCFAFLYIMLHPQVQEKVQAEIARVVGHGRWPSLDDKAVLQHFRSFVIFYFQLQQTNLHVFRMNYTEATIAESFRMTSVLPLSPRSTGDVACAYGPYEIPKNTIVLVNYYSVNMDKEFYGDPENFRPERFLDANGHLVNMERVLPFSLGKRKCLAEPTGRGTVFLVLTCLLQRYTFELDPHVARPTMTPIPGFTNSPQPYRAIIKKRVFSRLSTHYC